MKEEKGNMDLEKNICKKIKKYLNEFNEMKFIWIKNRINKYCEEWENFIKIEYNIQENFNITIYIIIGVLISEDDFEFGKYALKGGPLGELIQWSDTIMSLFHLGYDIKIIINHDQLKYKIKYLINSKAIFIDYIGLNLIYEIEKSFRNYDKFKCKLRIVDTFGTESKYNIGLEICYLCNNKLKNKQYFTMYPHTPDNSFLGFIVQKSKESQFNQKKNIAVIYAKNKNFIDFFESEKYLKTIEKYFELHFTFESINTDNRVYHGLLHGEDYFNLLKSAKLFVGLGFPFEGPAPLEAISHGCIYLNPIISSKMKKKVKHHFLDKPTTRFPSSQNPYCEIYIPSGYVYNIHMDSLDELENILRKVIKQKKFISYTPYEFTYSGMLDRLNFYLKNQDFCSEKTDFHKKHHYSIIIGSLGESCNKICEKNRMICEWDFFKYLNITSNDDSCSQLTLNEKLSLPGYFTYNNKNITCNKRNSLFYSCSSSSEKFIRLCPCREYTVGNIAIY